MIGANVSCPVCGFPAPAPSHIGQTAICANCGDKLEAEITQGFTVARVLLAGVIGFIIGIIASPSIREALRR